jgi:hypothetical protein
MQVRETSPNDGSIKVSFLQNASFACDPTMTLNKVRSVKGATGKSIHSQIEDDLFNHSSVCDESEQSQTQDVEHVSSLANAEGRSVL